jgi:type 1 glutamine amidotransferase
MLRRTVGGVVVGWLAWAVPLALGADVVPPIRAVILSNGGPDADALKAILVDSGRFQVRACETTEGIAPALLAQYDLAIVAGRVAGDAQKALAEFTASGKGVVVARGGLPAADAPSDSPLTATRVPDGSGGTLSVNVARAKHPIVLGLPSAFRVADAVPGGLATRTGAEPLAMVEAAGSAVPVLAVARSGKGRVAAIALGTDVSALHEPSYRVLLARSAEWAATGAVTLPPELPRRRSANAIRALLITGGHDHDAAFYSLFRDIKELNDLPVDTTVNAFKKDIRDKYDTIIFYDFTRELDEVGRQNLHLFVESGKGVVVLHHALLNFQTWSWWSEEVVGGRYRLQREQSFPISGVKNGQDFFVIPAGSHPVLNGIRPFHVNDEAYNNMYFSDRIKPLLTTDNPASDVTLAWIGPCRTSRVVAIQLGHGTTIFDHPTYRALVRNAVVWSAGREEQSR